MLHFDPDGQERIATWLAGEAPTDFLATSWADMTVALLFRYGQPKNVGPILLRLLDVHEGRSFLVTLLGNRKKVAFHSAVRHVLNHRQPEFPEWGAEMEKLRKMILDEEESQQLSQEYQDNLQDKNPFDVAELTSNQSDVPLLSVHAITSKEYHKNRLFSCRSSCIMHEDLQENNLQFAYDQYYEDYNQIIEQYCYQPHPYLPVLMHPTAMNDPLRKDPVVLRLTDTEEEKAKILAMAMDKGGGRRLQDCMKEGWAEDTEAIFDAFFHTNLLKEQDGLETTTFLKVSMHKHGNFVAQALVEVMSNAGRAEFVASSSLLPSSNQSDLWRKKLEYLMDTLNPSSAGAAEEHPLIKLALNDKGLRVVLRLVEGVDWDSPAKKKVRAVIERIFFRASRENLVLFSVYIHLYFSRMSLPR